MNRLSDVALARVRERDGVRGKKNSSLFLPRQGWTPKPRVAVDPVLRDSRRQP